VSGEVRSELTRAINARQLTMIAIGGAIGTGLFLASGSAISQAGPGGALLGYAIMGLAVYCMMQSLGEMATELPICGSFEAYAERFVDSSFAFALGWNYWLNWTITLAAELVASALIVKFWFPQTNTALWAMGFFAILMGLNWLSVRAYAEAEYWFSSIKVVTVILFLIVGALMIAGLAGGAAVGFQNWHLQDPDSGRAAPFVGGVGGVVMVFMVAGFSFQGTESVGLAAAEAEDPGTTVPRAIRSVFWRILLFYVGAIFVVGTLIGFTDPHLLSADESHVAFSPFTIMFSRLPTIGYYAANIMNAVILTAVLSCGNSAVYASTRMLHALAHAGKAPKVFGRLDRRGVPVAALLATGVVSAGAFFSNTLGDHRIYALFYNASGLCGFIAWIGIAVCHLRFRKAWVAQGRALRDLKFRARFYPYGPWLCLVLFLIVVFGANWSVFAQPEFSWFDAVSSYLMIPVVLMLYFVHKMLKKTRVVPLEDCRF